MLADLADENPASLLQACRRLIEYYPSTGAAWWLSARTLSAAERGGSDLGGGRGAFL